MTKENSSLVGITANSQKLFSVIFLFCAFTFLLGRVSPVAAATTLNTGDIAIIGIKMDDADEFSWVPLVDLEAGTGIYFTDTGFYSTTSDFNTSNFPAESLMLYTAPAGGVSSGVVQTVTGNGGDDYTMTIASGWGEVSNSSEIDFATNGDQLYAFQSSTAASSASFGTASDSNSTGLFAATAATTDWTSSSSSTDVNQSNLYPDLTDGTNAVAAGAGAGAEDENDNIRYEGITSGTAAQLLAAIANSANWTGTDTGPSADYTANGVTNFTVTAVPEPGTFAFLAGFGVCLTLLKRRPGKVRQSPSLVSH